MTDKKALLYDSAKELFAEKGLKDTSVADITQAAGVAVGTFYLYYPSKDRLFMEIFGQENAFMMKRLMRSIDLTEEPVPLIKKLLSLNMEGMLSNPILRQWYEKDVSEKIEKLYREENGIGGVGFLYGDFLRMVSKWQDQGKMRSDIDSSMIMAMFESIIRIGFLKEEIGLQYFPELQNHLTDFVLRGLTDCKK